MSIKSLIDAIVCFTRESTREKNVLRLKGDWFLTIKISLSSICHQVFEAVGNHS